MLNATPPAEARPKPPPPVAALPGFKRGDFIGDRIQVVNVLGEGGFGIVYLASSLQTQTTFALKGLRGELVRDSHHRESFRKEAQIWVDLGPHPNLVRAYWVAEIDGRLYIAMEYVPSRGGRPNSLEGYLEKKPPSLLQTLHWAVQFCHGMEHALSHGIRCHRDIKPGNILIGDDHVVRISDFGIAGLAAVPDTVAGEDAAPAAPPGARTVAGSAFGTPTHMSPEQFVDAASCDERSDVYSFGVVLHQMATGGRLPFLPPAPPPGVSAGAWYWRELRALHQLAPAPRLDSPLGAITARCLAKQPGERFSSFAALRGELEALQRAHGGVSASAPAPVEASAIDLHNRGISLLTLGRAAEALDVLDQALAKAPDRAPTWNSRGNALRTLGRPEEALGSFDRALALDGLYGSPWHGKGLVHADGGRDAEALACFARALSLDPRDASSWTAQGVILGRLKRTEEQLRSYEQALAIDPRSGLAWSNRGNVLIGLGRFAEALDSFDRAVACDPRSVPAWCGKGIALRAAGRRREALDAFDEALRIDPQDSISQNHRAECERQIAEGGGNDSPPAEPRPVTPRVEQPVEAPAASRPSSAEPLSAAPPEDTVADWNDRCTALYGQKRYDEALAAANRGLLVDPRNATSFTNVANCLFQLRRPEEALEANRRAIVAQPNYLAAWTNRAAMQSLTGRKAEAAGSAAVIVDLTTGLDAPEFRQARGQALAQLEGLERAGISPAPHTALAWLAVAYDAMARGNPAGALAIFDQGILSWPGDVDLRRWRGVALLEMGRAEEAVEAFERALDLSPSADLWHDKGRAYAALRLSAEALEAFDRAIALEPAHAGSWSDRGKALGVLNRHGEAEASLDRAIALAPRHPAPWQNRALLLDATPHREAEALAAYREFLARAGPDMVLQLEHAKARVAVLEARVAAAGGPSPASPARYPAVLPAFPAVPSAPVVAKASAPRGTPSRPLVDCLQRGEVSLRQGQAEVALGWFHQALMHDPASVRAWLGAGDALLRLERWADAAGHLEKAVELAPAQAPILHLYAQALDGLGLRVEALAVWDRATALVPDNLLLWNGRGATLLAMERYAEALACFDRALGLDPRYALAKFHKAIVQERLGHRAEAGQTLKQFLAIAPPNLKREIAEARRLIPEWSQGTGP